MLRIMRVFKTLRRCSRGLILLFVVGATPVQAGLNSVSGSGAYDISLGKSYQKYESTLGAGLNLWIDSLAFLGARFYPQLSLNYQHLPFRSAVKITLRAFSGNVGFEIRPPKHRSFWMFPFASIGAGAGYLMADFIDISDNTRHAQVKFMAALRQGISFRIVKGVRLEVATPISVFLSSNTLFIWSGQAGLRIFL
jgi:hypothetical protein